MSQCEQPSGSRREVCDLLARDSSVVPNEFDGKVLSNRPRVGDPDSDVDESLTARNARDRLDKEIVYCDTGPSGSRWLECETD